MGASSWNQALMDLGATICTAKQPRCMLCPFREQCAAAPALQSGDRQLADRSVPYTPKQSTFAGSTRYHRGRIVDALRTAGPEGVAVSELGTQVSVGDDVDAIVAGLVRDGLVVNHGGRLRLP